MKKVAPLLMLACLAINSVASACPMCKDSIPNSDAQQAGSLPGGFNSSVYLLLCGLIGVAGLVGTGIVRAVRATPVNPPSADGAFPVKRE